MPADPPTRPSINELSNQDAYWQVVCLYHWPRQSDHLQESFENSPLNFVFDFFILL
jgi:hypothetical protein